MVLGVRFLFEGLVVRPWFSFVPSGTESVVVFGSVSVGVDGFSASVVVDVTRHLLPGNFCAYAAASFGASQQFIE